MRELIGILFLSIVLCAPSWAQETNLINSCSPKLKKFVLEHPEARQALTRAISEAFSKKTIGLYYFYSDDESIARTFHYYPNAADLPEVVLCLRENQNPTDQFICILFETLNSQNENKFTNLMAQAYLGTIPKEHFAKEILRYEFEATKSVRTSLPLFKFGKKEIKDSHYYRWFIECPTNFEDFLSYSKKGSQRDVFQEYELKYDSLRKEYIDANSVSSVSNSPAKN